MNYQYYALGWGACVRPWPISMTTNAVTRTSSLTIFSLVSMNADMSVVHRADMCEIEGDVVMFADFGTAFDWTEFESDMTNGPPDAYTKLYVAPEVCFFLPIK